MVMLLVRVIPTAVADIDHAKRQRGRGDVLIVACGYSMMLYAVGFGPRALARPRCTRVPGTGGAGPTARAERRLRDTGLSCPHSRAPPTTEIVPASTICDRDGRCTADPRTGGRSATGEDDDDGDAGPVLRSVAERAVRSAA